MSTEKMGVKPEDLAVLVQTAVDKKDKENEVHWTVKVFGGALISVVAIVLIGAFQSAFQAVGECRKDIQQHASVILTKDEFNLRTKALWDGMRESRDQKAEIAGLRERIKLLEQQNRDLVQEIQKLRDRITPAPVQPQKK